MNNESKLISGFKIQGTIPRNPKYYTDEERCMIIEEWLASNVKKRDIWEKYTGQKEEHGHLTRWIRKLGYEDLISFRSHTFRSNLNLMNKKKPVKESDISFENLQLKKRIEELEKQLKDAEMKAIAFSTMVDIAEKEFKIPIRKKSNTKPSKK